MKEYYNIGDFDLSSVYLVDILLKIAGGAGELLFFH